MISFETHPKKQLISTKIRIRLNICNVPEPVESGDGPGCVLLPVEVHEGETLNEIISGVVFFSIPPPRGQKYEVLVG